jgi:zinc D-Ala-D-Ala carboxypeptidase
MKTIPFIISFICCSCLASAQSEKDYLLGKFEPASHDSFVKLEKRWSAGSAVNGYLRKEAYEAFVKMATAARLENVKLVIISATRNFDRQKTIWENKWNGKVTVGGVNLTTLTDPSHRARQILLYSSMPGTSRHHWGTDIDLNALEESYFQSGEGKKVYQWLQKNAATYGFCQPYTSKNQGRTGYEEEKWHWSYLPLSVDLLKRYNAIIQSDDIQGFLGSETAAKVEVIKNYVNGVACK